MEGVGSMKKEKIFYRDESASYPGKYMIRADLEKFHLNYTEGSYNIIGARLMGLTYAQYLRMCRDIYGAEIIGKGNLYPYPVFKLSKGLEDLIEQLNARANLVLWEREHPDFEEHAEFVKEKNPRFYAEVTGNADNS
jgi:hypothetical protein